MAGWHTHGAGRLAAPPLRRGRPVRTHVQAVVHHREPGTLSGVIASAMVVVSPRAIPVASFPRGAGALAHVRVLRMARTRCTTPSPLWPQDGQRTTGLVPTPRPSGTGGGPPGARERPSHSVAAIRRSHQPLLVLEQHEALLRRQFQHHTLAELLVEHEIADAVLCRHGILVLFPCGRSHPGLPAGGHRWWEGRALCRARRPSFGGGSGRREGSQPPAGGAGHRRDPHALHGHNGLVAAHLTRGTVRYGVITN